MSESNSGDWSVSRFTDGKSKEQSVFLDVPYEDVLMGVNEAKQMAYALLVCAEQVERNNMGVDNG